MAPPDLDLRVRSVETPLLRRELARLIRDEFEIDVTPLDRLGHDPSLVSFGWWSGDALVANVSLARETPWLAGERCEAFHLQFVVVRPEWRGRGLFRALMIRALAHADTRADLVLLATETPELYGPFGFRPFVETAFLGPLAPGGARPNRRRLSLATADDVALIRDLFARRTPVSRICAAGTHSAAFFLKALESPEIALIHLPDLDAVVAVEEDDPEVLCLLDVVAPAIPPLDTIAAALGGRATRARVLVTPDRLDWRPQTHEPEEAGTMTRGPVPIGDTPVVLSPMRI
ncbi:GNAT family N-acetyltransferase [Pinisolibacter aquiterrae]|uniref:GNAT family N-acetyltransferase n=1 Tax=Pinisolibacter aquiterrae TaxID=2815579 RepID=UPI001C3E1E39|nr:GNAT family N-acetyltransferase [Pinisolibacter aquiterrae]MBV5262776.1 GNAT family N-acetyltransferase [Pinisolibacter aquiterrae]MCC8233596.1 GNAT family N-acetyltransferase [Pinisolibacter aquiterrae]